MFETNTYEAILQRLLDRIPDTMDKREGAVIYDALAPAAIELNLAYVAAGVFAEADFCRYGRQGVFGTAGVGEGCDPACGAGGGMERAV